MNEQDLSKLFYLRDEIDKLIEKYEGNDVELHHGNGSISYQLSCASASIECIVQEF